MLLSVTMMYIERWVQLGEKRRGEAEAGVVRSETAVLCYYHAMTWAFALKMKSIAARSSLFERDL